MIHNNKTYKKLQIGSLVGKVEYFVSYNLVSIQKWTLKSKAMAVKLK